MAVATVSHADGPQRQKFSVPPLLAKDGDDWVEGIEPVQRAGRELLSVEVVATSLASTLYSADPTTQHDHDNQ